MYLSCLFISVFFFVCLFQFLDSPSQKFTLSNFDQEVAFNQYFYLYQEFMFVVCFFVYLSACFWCLDYSRTDLYFVSRTWWKEEITNFWERRGSYFGYKKIWIFIGPISMYFNDFSFLLHISSKVINKFWCQTLKWKGLGKEFIFRKDPINILDTKKPPEFLEMPPWWMCVILYNTCRLHKSSVLLSLSASCYYCDNNCCKTKPG